MSHPYSPLTNSRPTKMRLASVCWLPIASPDYFADVLARGSNAPIVRNHRTLNQDGGKPDFIVLSFKEVIRGFDSGKKDSNATVVEMVLMDGSYTCIVARLNSGIVYKLRKNHLLPGSGIRVLDHQFIWHWSSRANHWKGILFITDFEWSHPPAVNSFRYKEAEEAASFACEDFQKDRFDLDTIDYIKKTRSVVPLNYKMEDNGSWYWTQISVEGFTKGFWIRNKDTKHLWPVALSERRKRTYTHREELMNNPEYEFCKCQEEYGLKDCVLEAFLLYHVNYSDVFQQVVDRLGEENVSATKWDELSQNHKRWALYWFYSVNIFCHKGRKKLPMCFVKHVRGLYPDPVGSAYTGFKLKDEEA
jgi:hypothetical protein